MNKCLLLYLRFVINKAEVVFPLFILLHQLVPSHSGVMICFNSVGTGVGKVWKLEIDFPGPGKVRKIHKFSKRFGNIMKNQQC